MDDLISRQAAIDEIKEIYEWHDNVTKERIIEHFKQLPSAQPEITHCAECLHWKHSAVRKSYCEVFDWVNTADDFCSFAERRKGEGNL